MVCRNTSHAWEGGEFYLELDGRLSLANLISSGFNERSCSNTRGREPLRKMTKANLWPPQAHTRMCINTSICSPLDHEDTVKTAD